MASEFEIKQYKVKALPSVPRPNSIFWVKADADTQISGYITDLNGIPFNLKDIFGVNLTQNVIDGDTLNAPSGNAVYDFVTSQIGSLIREEFEYTGSQTFTTANNYSQVYSVDVRGVGALSLTQYDLLPPNQITITDPLEAGDFVVVLYSQYNAGVLPYYTQAQTDNFLAQKEDLSNKQDSLDFDGTGDKYPTVDTVNEAFLRNTKLFARTGIANKNDQFELEVFDANTIRIKPVDSVVFWDELFAPNAVSSDAIKTFPQKIYPLSELVTATGGNINTVPIVADGVYVRYLGYDVNGNVISSPDSFIEISSVAQLGFTTVLKVGGVVSFLGGITPGARNVFSQPILANLSDLDRITVTATTDISINYNIGSPSLESLPGTITGIAINWRGLNNPNNTSPIDKFNYLGDPLVDFVTLDPTSLSQTTPFTFHTLWTELDEGIAVNESFFNTTSQLRDTLDAGAFGVKRVLIGVRGGIFIQESEFATSAAYTTIEEAKANVFTHEFTDAIIPSGLVIEIARIIFQKGVTDFSDETKFYIVITAGGAGSGGGITSVGDATSLTKGIIQLAGDISGTATNVTVPGLLLKANDADVIHNTGDEVKTGNLTVNAIIKSGGTSSEFLMADGSTSTAGTITTNVQAGTSYIILESDNGKQIITTNSSPVTITIPTGLSSGFSCEIYQSGTGQVTVQGTGTTLVYSTFELPSTQERYSLVGIDNTNVINEYHLYGSLESI